VNSRRTLLRTAIAAAAAGPAVLRHWTEARAQDRTLVVCTWGGLFQKAHEGAFARPFEKETGATIRYVTQPSSAKIKAQVESGNIEWDVVDTQGHQFYRAARENLFEPLDYAVIDRADIHPAVVHTHGIGSIFYAMVIGYNARKYTRDTAPRTWADVYDLRRFPGKRSLSTFVYRTMETALLADGVPPDKLYPLDLERGLRKMDTIKDHVVWWSTGPQATDVLARGDVDFGEMTNGHVAFAKQKGVAVDQSWNGPALLCNDMWGILRGSKKKDLAMRYIAFACTQRPQAEFAKLEPYGPVNRKAYDLIPGEVARELPSVVGRIESLVLVNDRWWGDNEAVGLEKFNTWRLRR
jgi:putative spermidine/putrescine transport system substrate-binding protein